MNPVAWQDSKDGKTSVMKRIIFVAAGIFSITLCGYYFFRKFHIFIDLPKTILASGRIVKIATLVIVYVSYIIVYRICLSLLKVGNGKNQKSYRIYVYRTLYLIILMIVDFALVLGNIVLLCAAVGRLSDAREVSIMWVVMLSIYIWGGMIAYAISVYKLVINVDEDRIVYCSFTKRYTGSLKDIKELTVQGKRLVIEMKDGSRIECPDNLHFFEKLSSDLNITLNSDKKADMEG